MPSSFYGTGTRFLGKWNRSVRTDTCVYCKRRIGVLTSYDTRLWFAVSLHSDDTAGGESCIVDSCSICHLHEAFAADAYAQVREGRFLLALTRFHEKPSIELALAAHATMLEFHELEKAASLRGACRLLGFPNQVELLERLAGAARCNPPRARQRPRCTRRCCGSRPTFPAPVWRSQPREWPKAGWMTLARSFVSWMFRALAASIRSSRSRRSHSTTRNRASTPKRSGYPERCSAKTRVSRKIVRSGRSSRNQRPPME